MAGMVQQNQYYRNVIRLVPKLYDKIKLAYNSYVVASIGYNFNSCCAKFLYVFKSIKSFTLIIILFLKQML